MGPAVIELGHGEAKLSKSLRSLILLHLPSTERWKHFLLEKILTIERNIPERQVNAERAAS